MELKDTTIIVPIFNRQKYINNVIEYYKGFNLLFVDSSNTPFDYPEEVNFIECSGMLLYEALNKALKQIDTKYVCWNNDDDIATKDFLVKGEEFLLNNPDYSNVLGQQIKVHKDLSPTHDQYGKKEYNVWKKGTLISDKTIDRIHYMNNYFHTPVHGIMLKECLLDSTLIPLNDDTFYPIKYFDRIVGIVQACYGNKKVLPMISCLRRENSRMINSKNYPEQLKKYVRQNNLVNHFKEDKNYFIDYLLSKELSLEEIRSINFNNKL